MDAMQSIGYIYCGISVLCAFILIASATTITRIMSRFTISRYVFYSYLFAGLAALFDCAYALREINGIVFPPIVSYALTLAYFICVELTGTFWVIYAEKKLNSWFCRSKKRFIVFTVPLLALILVTLSTPLTHYYFFFENNTYERGPLFLFISFLSFVYVVQNGVKALIQSCKKENYVERHELRRLFIYAFAYLLIQAIQLTSPAVFPYRSVGTMLVFGVFLIQHMQELIGLDGLTHVNNRYAADRYLGTMMSQSHDFELAILDIDKFKGINDKYGHLEGDKALKLVAEAITKASPKNCFFARFGGDEFVFVNSDKNVSLADMENEINQALEELTRTHGCAYPIAVSVGYTVNDGTVNSIPDLLRKADEQLYIRKKNKR